MCRWVAYSGSSITLDTLLFRPEHSLVSQSLKAQRSIYATNGDGFGVGWYTELPTPGVYRDIHPAWNDQNLRNLSEHLNSGLFLAHVRATTGTAIQRTNCHPFRHGRWLFQHNGEVPEFEKVKRELALEILPELYPKIEGSTDSEILFYLALSLGLEEDPVEALKKVTIRVEGLRKKYGIRDPFRLTAVTTGGKKLFAVRYASEVPSNTLFYSRNLHAIREVCGDFESIPQEAVVILSEPLDNVSEHWLEVPESSYLVVDRGQVTLAPLELD